MEHIIEVKNIGKKYNITHQQGGYVALRDVLTAVLRHPFAFLKRKAKKAMGLETKEIFWALKNINFTVTKGEVIGIIGSNGAGKSTLLKILSQITPPTTGEIRIEGRVGSLLEVGTGFHPELTGRENIFLNGAILGMKKNEIAKKFNAIVAFAGIEKFLDTPVKYYSSGMYVRLAFSVAAHMEPDILIIDEVLAVGDSDFQKKCLGKMEEVTSQEGRTILFVSHNLDAIRRICTKTIWIQNGTIAAFGETKEILTLYGTFGSEAQDSTERWVNTGTTLHTVFEPSVFEVIQKEDEVMVSLQGNLKKKVKDLTLGYALYDENENLLYWSYHTDVLPSPTLVIGANTLYSSLPLDLINSGTYRLELIGGIHGKTWFFEPGKGNPSIKLTIQRDFSHHPYWNQRRPGSIAPRIPWKS